MYQIDVIETSPTKATVIVESSTLKEQDLLRSGRVQDALDLLDNLERKINRGDEVSRNDLSSMIISLNSYDPHNEY